MREYVHGSVRNCASMRACVRACVRQLVLAEGANVALLARRPEVLAEAKAVLLDLCHTDEHVMCYSVDVVDAVGMVAALDAVQERYGRVDVLVHSAGVSLATEFENTTAAQFENVLKARGLWSGVCEG